jgi:hypothetical protein
VDGAAHTRAETRGIGSNRLADFNFTQEPPRGPVSETGRKILAHIPTRFGRLVFLSSLRDGMTGRYAHPSLIEIAGREIADRTLSHNHHRIFTEWLGLNLSDQKEDLDQYLRTSRIAPADVPYRELTPATAHQVERQLYLTDLEILLQLLSFEGAGAFAPPKASPRR